MIGTRFFKGMAEHEFNIGYLLIAALGGLFAGMAVAYLTAPSSGKETRKQIGSYFKSSGQAVARFPGKLRKEMGKARSFF